MFLRCTTRKKNGKEHRYWNLVENRRVAGGQVVQRQVLYLGEINYNLCKSRGAGTSGTIYSSGDYEHPVKTSYTRRSQIRAFCTRLARLSLNHG
jgi:hypothetical protein